MLIWWRCFDGVYVLTRSRCDVMMWYVEVGRAWFVCLACFDVCVYLSTNLSWNKRLYSCVLSALFKKIKINEMSPWICLLFRALFSLHFLREWLWVDCWFVWTKRVVECGMCLFGDCSLVMIWIGLLCICMWCFGQFDVILYCVEFVAWLIRRICFVEFCLALLRFMLTWRFVSTKIGF